MFQSKVVHYLFIVFSFIKKLSLHQNEISYELLRSVSKRSFSLEGRRNTTTLPDGTTKIYVRQDGVLKKGDNCLKNGRIQTSEVCDLHSPSI